MIAIRRCGQISLWQIPPFNLSDWGQDKLTNDQRWKYGIPPAGNANFAWMQHMIYHLAPNGRLGLVLANGSLSSQSGGEGEIRKRIVEADLVEGIIAMPGQLFYTTQIPVSLWFLNRNKPQKKKTLFIDARNMGTMVSRTLRELNDKDIQKIAKAFDSFRNGKTKNVQGFCAVSDTATIASHDFVLTPGRYVGIAETEEDSEPFNKKMKRLTGELSEMFAQSQKLEKEIKKQLGGLGYEIG
jgi:type I restriction enzyme M protein